MDLILPYKVGDLAESKSLIHNMRVRLGYLECYLEYIDYPGETIVDETWQIGDRVDWLKEGCYWSGTITKIINEDLVEIELPAPPIGEGKCYKAKCSDLRPTLEWSLARGWMVPLSQANGKGWHAARLLQHYKSESDDDNDDNDSWDARQTVCRASNTPEEAPGPMVPAPPSATNNAPSHMYQKDAAVTSTEDLLKPSSTSKSPDPRHDAQASTQPAGTGVSMKPEPVIGVSTIKKEDSSLTEGEVDGGTEECLEKLGAIKARLKYLMQGTRLEHERSATFRG
uniref:Agenet domain-containing protein n=1 Tax=Zea mays TaxID=4577 RepID=A0A804ULR1_MAIZE